jgi:hypothetical protein
MDVTVITGCGAPQMYVGVREVYINGERYTPPTVDAGSLANGEIFRFAALGLPCKVAEMHGVSDDNVWYLFGPSFTKIAKVNPKTQVIKEKK